MIRVRVTELVDQIGFTNLLKSQGRGNILAASSKQQQAAASSSKQATELISAYPHISASIDGTSPKLSWYIVLVIIYKPTRFWVETHQGTGSAGKKVLKIPKKSEQGPGRALARTGPSEAV